MREREREIERLREMFPCITGLGSICKFPYLSVSTIGDSYAVSFTLEKNGVEVL